MDDSSSVSERDPLERLAAEFLDRRRRGEDPSPAEYARLHPEVAEQILEFFPALEVMEGLKPAGDDRTASHDGRVATARSVRLEQLGEYRIIREIGHGGMGVVYEAIQESLGRRVALKILPLHGRVDPVQIERFRLESRSAARLHHGHIVPVYGMGEHEGVYYYAMQYIQGHGLDVILDDLRRLRDGGTAPAQAGGEVGGTGSMAVARSFRAGRFTPPGPAPAPSSLTATAADETAGTGHTGPPPAGADGRGSVLSQPTESGYYRAVARLGVQVAAALAHAHGQGVLHRDIKPSNLLLDAAGHVWVADFGLAKLEGCEGPTQTGDIVGTLRYMAPERFEGWSDRRSDLYGLGMTLYELLTLRPAYEAATRAKLIERVIHDPPPAPRKLDPRIPRDLETIVSKAIAKEPGERYATAEALSTDLENFLTDRPIVARPSGLPERAWRWCRRNPAAAGFLGAIAVAALALVGLGVTLSVQSRLRAAHGEADRQRAIAEDALRQERIFLYANRVIFAHRELGDHNPRRADELLDECPPDRRGWEWHYLKRQCRTEVLTLVGHGGPVYSLAFTPDGRHLASTGDDRTARIWDADTGRLVHTWDGYRGPRWGLALSPDGRRVAAIGGSTSEPDPVLVRDVQTGEVLLKIDARTGTHSSAAFSSDGRRLVIAEGDLARGQSHIQIRDASSGRAIRRIPTGDEPAYSPSFSFDGNCVLATVGNNSAYDPAEKINRVVVWDADTGAERFSLRDHRAPVMFACFSPDGKTIASGGYDAVVRLYDAEDGRLRRELTGHGNCVNQIAFGPGGRLAASSSDDNTVIIWDVAGGRPVSVLSGHRGGIFGVAFHPEGKRLATSGYDGEIKVWDVDRSKVESTLIAPAHPGRVSCLAFDRRGEVLASAGVDRTITLREMPGGRMKATLTGHREHVWGVAFSPDGRLIASAGGDWRRAEQAGEVRIWDGVSGRIVHALQAHRGIAWTVAFSPDGSMLASGGGEPRDRDDAIVLWDVASGRPIRRIRCPDGGVRSIAFGPDGREVAATTGDSARSWDVRTGEALTTFAGHNSAINQLAYRGDGGRLATAGMDLAIRIWNPEGVEVRRLLGHGWDITGLAFSPDGRRLASVGGDKRLKVWDADNGQELLSLEAHDTIIWAVAFSPDGHRIATADQRGIIKLWDGMPRAAGAR